MFKTETSPFGMEVYYLFRNQRTCSIIERNGTWFFLITGRSWIGEYCRSRHEAEQKAFSYLQELRSEFIDQVIFDSDFNNLRRQILVEEVGRETGIS